MFLRFSLDTIIMGIFEARSYKPISRDLPSSLVQPRGALTDRKRITLKITGHQRPEGTCKCRLQVVRVIIWLAALYGIGHVLYRERQMWETLCFAIFEAEFVVPALQFHVFADDTDANGLY